VPSVRLAGEARHPDANDAYSAHYYLAPSERATRRGDETRSVPSFASSSSPPDIAGPANSCPYDNKDIDMSDFSLWATAASHIVRLSWEAPEC
jgi:hypothetical protein